MKELKPLTLGGQLLERPIIISGPCSAETEEQTLETAKGLCANGIKIFRAGIWKPRTKPGGFEGVGEEGLAWLKKVKKETGMYTSTEVATRAHVDAALDAGVDMLWIGARTSANPFAMQEIADALSERGADIPVLVKNPVNRGLELLSVFTMPASGNSAQSIAVSALMESICTGICLSGIYLSSFVAVCRICL